ncbi:MAG: hypothetical protein NUV92_00050 [Ignavibacteria bacterium]|jgi:hypothetical protein|nr:hypothetical protein [Ignavibacteria bacterium]MDH7528988.1 hypothetical protein [Ignavibacteria bacterium]NPV11229.1 hypothetical protein [Ignavibacteria bacterium]
MKLDWSKYLGFEINIIMKEYYGVVQTSKMDEPFYEIVFKAGRLTGVFDDGLMITGKYNDQIVESFIPFESIKCVDIFHPIRKEQ